MGAVDSQRLRDFRFAWRFPFTLFFFWLAAFTHPFMLCLFCLSFCLTPFPNPSSQFDTSPIPSPAASLFRASQKTRGIPEFGGGL
ncbi:hypothetical protein V8C40DRAFT_237088, partial [Trichoderma camerunense]